MIRPTSLSLLVALLLAFAPAARAITPRRASPPAQTTQAPFAQWVSIEVLKDNKKVQFIYLKTQAKSIADVGDAPFSIQFPLYTAEKSPDNPALITARPTSLALRVTESGATGRAKIVTAADGQLWFEAGSYSGIKTDLRSSLGLPADALPTIAVGAAAAPSADPNRFTAYEQVLRDTLLPEAERAACDRSPKECREKALTQNAQAYVTRAKAAKPDEALDSTEKAYAQKRLGDDYAKLEEKMKSGEPKPAAVRAKIAEEIEAYTKQGDKTAYDPANVKGLRALLGEPKKETPQDPERATDLGQEIYKQFQRLFPNKVDLAAHEREIDMMIAYFKGRPEERNKIVAMLEGQNDSNKEQVAKDFESYRGQAMAAARAQILTPAAGPSPFGNNKEEDLLDAYCDALAGKAAPAPAANCQAADANQAMASLKAAACTRDGRAFDGNTAPAPGDQDKINQKCGKWLAEHEKARKSRITEQEQQPIRDDLANRGRDNTKVPLGDCKENCGDPKKEGVNDKLPWEIGAAWAAVAIVALGILMPGAGLAIAAGAMAAGAVGWYMGKESNR